MSFWKNKVVPKFKKLFDKGKKKGALEAVKTFDGSKESLEKEIEEKKGDLHPKILEIYRSTTTFVSKKLLKEPSEGAIKDHPDAAQSILADLAKAGFPGAELLSGAGSKFGVSNLPGPVLFLFQKTSTFLVEEELAPPEEEKREVEGGGEAPPPATAAVSEEKKEEEEAVIITTEEKKEEEETATSSSSTKGEEAAPPPPPPATVEKDEEKKEEASPPPAAPEEEKKEEVPPAAAEPVVPHSAS